jgi:hypothetical protein
MYGFNTMVERPRQQGKAQILRGMFPGRLISRFGDIPWPACSPDLTDRLFPVGASQV